jgi:hypothetical protein
MLPLNYQSERDIYIKRLDSLMLKEQSPYVCLVTLYFTTRLLLLAHTSIFVIKDSMRPRNAQTTGSRCCRYSKTYKLKH